MNGITMKNIVIAGTMSKTIKHPQATHPSLLLFCLGGSGSATAIIELPPNVV
jgi:hypothetical protein